MSDFSIIIYGILIVFFSAIVQGVTAFGFALMSMPLLTILLTLHTVVPIMIFFGCFAGGIMLLKIWSDVQHQKVWFLIVAGVAATPLGAYLLLIVEQSVLKIIVGIMIVLFAIALWKGYSVKIKNERLAFIPVGFSSGLLNGSLALNGPPIILFLANQETDKATFRANVTAFGFTLNLVTIIYYYMVGIINDEVIKYALWFSPALILGTIIGIKLANKIEQKLFRKITLILIIISGLSAIITSIF